MQIENAGVKDFNCVISRHTTLQLPSCLSQFDFTAIDPRNMYFATFTRKYCALYSNQIEFNGSNLKSVFGNYLSEICIVREKMNDDSGWM